MKKVDYNLNNPHINEYKLSALKRIKEDDFYKDIISCYDLSDDEIIASASKLLKFKEDRLKCKSCSGKCNKIPKLLQFELVFDDETRKFDIEFNTCDLYKKSLLKRRKFLKQDFPDNYLEYDFYQELIHNDYANERKKVLKAFAEILNKTKNNSIYLYGDSRMGKTFISSLFASKYVEDNNSIASFCSSSDIFNELKDLNFQDKNACKVLLDELINVDLLVIDGFGNEYKSDFIRDTYVYPILNERSINNKLTIITSNFTIDEITSMYLLSKASAPKVRQLKSLLSNEFKYLELTGYPYKLNS